MAAAQHPRMQSKELQRRSWACESTVLCLPHAHIFPVWPWQFCLY